MLAALAVLALTSCAAVPAAQEGNAPLVLEIPERMQRGREYTIVVAVDGAESIDFTIAGRFRDLKVESVTGGTLDPRSYAGEGVGIFARGGDGGPLGFRVRLSLHDEALRRPVTAQLHAIYPSAPSLVENRAIVIE